jgi:peptide deformylase
MAIKPILRRGDPRLLEHAKPVATIPAAAITPLIRDLFDTLRETGGVGLAAPQIGVSP